MTAVSRSGSPAASRGAFGRLRVAAGSVGAAILGIAPHVLHHAGPLAGAALFAGAGGTALFGALGLVAALPMLHRLRRRTGGWAAPIAALALFASVFALSTFVLGPALTGSGTESRRDPGPAVTTPARTSPEQHEEHHP